MSEWPHPNDRAFSLEPPRRFRGPEILLNKRIASLREITPQRTGQERTLQDALIDQLVARLRMAREKGWQWEEATNVRRRKWALLRMYTLYLGAPKTAEWLHPFDDGVAKSILGTDASKWHPSRRREVTQFFFAKFDRIQCIERVADMLRNAWNGNLNNSRDQTAKIWSKNAEILFQPHSPEILARELRQGEGISELAARFHVHESGRFRECLYEAVLISRLQSLPFGGADDELFRLVEKDKQKSIRDGRTLGSKAVEILIQRSISEGQSNVPENWSSLLVPLACDPRSPDPGTRHRWWSWANAREKQVAIRALTGLNIREFIMLLEQSLRGSGNSHQFGRRRDFLLQLFDRKIIYDARVVVHDDLYRELDKQTRKTLQPSRVSGGSQRTSFIALHCQNDVFFVEGTYNFALRGYVGKEEFPIKNFWSSPPSHFGDGMFRTQKLVCDIYQTHHRGDWEGGVLHQLRTKFHIDWSYRSRTTQSDS